MKTRHYTHGHKPHKNEYKIKSSITHLVCVSSHSSYSIHNVTHVSTLTYGSCMCIDGVLTNNTIGTITREDIVN